ncbi:hypothetical protein C7Y71_003100 [Pseudoprevotella muciniphila]|uniref:Uncharacterized protein n=1 Tax=Pseudoprevotella muciniphila TaxID=2133944 RepID=A0A5P8E578_9BACT|nr:hypothetical protein [Pseudoprevotella muciniphila]QFQ12087.1 hypothetical protein C7Y71_003100 [Pseudoprevotella muciniphila]
MDFPRRYGSGRNDGCYGYGYAEEDDANELFVIYIDKRIVILFDMATFILMIAIIVICGLLFGKADTKKELLNQVGLDLSENNCKNKKENEFRKYSIKAMKAVVDLDYYNARNEKEFLTFLSDKLDLAQGRYVDDDFGGSKYESLNLGVKTNYVKHAERVIYRREMDIKKGNDSPLSKSVVFSDKKSAKKYCELLWEKYQYPWPENWLQKDGM